MIYFPNFFPEWKKMRTLCVRRGGSSLTQSAHTPFPQSSCNFTEMTIWGGGRGPPPPFFGGYLEGHAKFKNRRQIPSGRKISGRKKEKRRIMPSLVATTSASARTTFVRTHFARTNNSLRPFGCWIIFLSMILYSPSHEYILGTSSLSVSPQAATTRRSSPTPCPWPWVGEQPTMTEKRCLFCVEFPFQFGPTQTVILPTSSQSQRCSCVQDMQMVAGMHVR